MKKFRLKATNIDKFIESLEQMIDARDDMHEEGIHHNIHRIMYLKDNKYLPAKQALEEALRDFIIEVVEEEE